MNDTIKSFIAKFDEIEKLGSYIYNENIGIENPTKVIDEIEDLLILAFVFGNEQTSKQLDIVSKVDETSLTEALNIEYEGKTFRNRIADYVESQDEDAFMNVVRTEWHRMYNTGSYDCASKSMKQTMKVWNTVMDNRVRETHKYLEGKKIPLDEEFFTYDGDSGLYPGGFKKVENNAQCRCVLTFEGE